MSTPTPSAFTNIHQGRTWTVDVVETTTDHLVLRVRSGKDIQYVAIGYSVNPYHQGSIWWEFGEERASADAARADLDAGRTTAALPGGKLEALLRAAILPEGAA